MIDLASPELKRDRRLGFKSPSRRVRGMAIAALVVLLVIIINGVARRTDESAIATEMITKYDGVNPRVEIHEAAYLPTKLFGGRLGAVTVRADGLTLSTVRLTDIQAVSRDVSTDRPHAMASLEFHGTISDDSMSASISEEIGRPVQIKTTAGKLFASIPDRAGSIELLPRIERSALRFAPDLVGAQNHDVAILFDSVALELVASELSATGLDAIAVIEGGIRISAVETVGPSSRIFLFEPEGS